MGYFCNYDIERDPCSRDHSYTPPEKLLLWRLEELQDRLEELRAQGGQFERRVSFSDADLRYILPEHFKWASDVEAAIELAISDLADRYGIHIREEHREEPPAVDELTGAQITFLDLFALHTSLRSPTAA